MDPRVQVALSKATAAIGKAVLQKTFFRSPAGKKRIAARMVKLFPAHKTYVEPFVGSGAVFFEKEPAALNVLNDMDPEIAGAFKSLAALDEAGLAKLSAMDWVGSRKAFDTLKSSEPKDEIGKLHKFLYIRNFSYGGFGKSFADSNEGRAASALTRIKRFGPKMKGVHVHCGDYEDVVRKYDSPDTLFFLDPPYVGFGAGVGEGEFDEQRFMKVLKGIKGKFLVNYGVRGEFPKMARQEKGFFCRRIKTRRVFANWKGSGTISHLLVTNYEPMAKALEKAAEAIEKGFVVIDPELAKELDAFESACRKDEEAFKALVAAGPPNEWSGAVAAALGPDMCKRVKALWDSLPPTEQEEAHAAWMRGFDKALEKALDLPTAKLYWNWMKQPGAQGFYRGQRVDLDSVKKTVEFQGITVLVDRPAGFTMGGVDENGAKWTRTYQVDYGFIPKTDGGDGEGLDVFLGPDAKAPIAFWVEQHKPDGSFDEYKVVLGVNSEEEAVKIYQAHIPARFMGEVFEVPVAMMRTLLGPLAPQEAAKAEPPAKPEPPATQMSPLDWLKKLGPPETWSAEATASLSQDQVQAITAYWSQLALGEKDAFRAQWSARSEAAKRASFSAASTIIKGVDPGDERFVLGIVLKPEEIDAQDDIYSADEIRQAAHKFMTDFGGLGLQHQVNVNGKVKILETYIAPQDLTFGSEVVKKGTWLLGVRVLDDKLWSMVKSGELTGFSIGGSARRVPADETA